MEKGQDRATYLKHFYSILLEFDLIYASRERESGGIFHDRFGFSIKLWIDEVGWQQMA